MNHAALTRRWKNVAIVALAVFCTCLVALWLFRESLPESDAAPPWFWGSVILLAGLLVFRNGLRPAMAALGLPNAFHWPPYWVGAMVGVGVAFLVVGATSLVSARVALDEASLAWMSAGGVGLTLIPGGVALLSHGRRRRRRDAMLAADKKVRLPPYEGGSALERLTGTGLEAALDAWLRTDEAVESATQDFLGRRDLARLIATRLSPPNVPSQAVLGALGAGKSSLFHLVKGEAENVPTNGIRREFVALGLWRYETPRAAVEGILGALVSQLSKEVNVVFLRGIPRAYAEAMTAAGGALAVLPRLTVKVSDPVDALRDLDAAAAAIGIHYVVWIEDLERFAAVKPNARELTPEQGERVAPVRALLYALDSLTAFSVIVATTELFQDFDLDKIARYVERIPEVDAFVCRKVFAHLRNKWLSVPGMVDPATREERRSAGWPEALSVDDDDALVWRAFFGRGVYRIADAVAVLCRTPRTLKQCLRRAQELLSLLAGEVDVDDVLALCAVRESSPEGFRILVDRYKELSSPPSRRSGGDKQESPLAMFDAELVSVLLSEEQRSAIQRIAREVFVESKRPQGLRQSNDKGSYMDRFLAPHALRDEDKDQPTLRVLAGGELRSVVDELASDRALKVEHFARLLSTETLVALVVPLVDRLLSTPAPPWVPSRRLPDRPLPPGLVELWRMLRDRGGLDQSALAKALENAIERALPRNLRLVHELDHWFLTHSVELDDILPLGDRDGIRSRFRGRLASMYQGRADDLARQCEGAPEYLLVWLCWGLERVREHEMAGIPFAEWPVLAQTLVESCERNPSMLAQIAPFVTVEAGQSWNSRERRFDEARCVALFGSVRLLERLFAVAVDVPVSESVRAVQAYFLGRDGVGGVAVTTTDVAGADAAAAASRLRVRVGGVGDLVAGRWFLRREDAFEAGRVVGDYAVLPRQGLLTEGASCLILVYQRGVWKPLSEAAEYDFVDALRAGAQAYFVPERGPALVCRFVLAGGLSSGEVGERFSAPVARLAADDRNTLLVECVGVGEVDAGDDAALVWLSRNSDTLRVYAGKHIAIGDTDVVDSDESLASLLERIGDSGSGVTLHYVPADEEI